jgi:biotin operon repressor
VLVEELTIYSDAASQQVHCLADTLERARHLQRSSSLGVSASVSASASDSVGAVGANLGLSAAAIEEKIQKIEDALLEGRISETTYRELKQKYESLR